ncbi:hypothetical protein F4677DRAFT_414519 [Hypoxylon crocopeplum]|nr:hypothetical protein F4677DRAFT_414519 [Hypoxylon crocopeplum]
MSLPTSSSIILGPLTTTWIPPPACSVVVGACSTCDFGWQAQTCPGSNTVQDNTGCWPPRTPGVQTPAQPLLAWGVYSPANVCPSGYSTACSYNGAIETGDFTFDFRPKTTETVIGCCPTGYTCYQGGYGQTCSAVLTSTTVPTVTCESGTSAHFQYLTIPFAVAAADSAEIISTFTAYAPLFQLVDEVSSTFSSGSSPLTSSLSISSSASVSPPAEVLPTGSASAQGLSTGAKAGIGCGVGLGVILFGTMAFFLFRSRRQNNRGNDGGNDGEIKTDPYPPMPSEMSAGLPAELEAHHRV